MKILIMFLTLLTLLNVASPSVALTHIWSINAHVPSVPSIRRISSDPNYSFSLQSGYYEYFNVTTYEGQNITFTVTSSTEVNIYVMSSSQFSQFSSTGSSNYIFHALGTRVSGNVGPLSSGSYFLVVDNNVSNSTASVNLAYSVLPLIPFLAHSSPPAPIGIADYGVMNTTSGLKGYILNFDEVMGHVKINKIGAYNATPPSGINPYGASLQLNVVLQVNTPEGGYQYWLQDVLHMETNESMYYVEDNIWNFTSYPSTLSNSSVKGRGAVYNVAIFLSQGNYYAYGTPLYPYHLPLSMDLLIKEEVVPNGVVVSFGYYNGTLYWYDNATISAPGVTSAYMMVSGFNYTGNGYTYYDAELVFGGDANGEFTYFTSMNSTLSLSYHLLNGSWTVPPELYGFGADTEEAADNLATVLVNGVPTVEIGRENFFSPLQVINTPMIVNAQMTPIRTEAGLPVLLNLTASEVGGVVPLTYLVYLDGSPVQSYTVYNNTFNVELNLGILPTGTHQLTLVVRSASGQEVIKTFQFTVSSEPQVHISSPIKVLDLGQQLQLSVQASGGTPPYTLELYINGVKEGQVEPGSVTLNFSSPGTYDIYVNLTDSSGYTVSSNVIQVQVNPDPTLLLSLSKAELDLKQGDILSLQAQGGTPPYTLSLTVNGTSEPVKLGENQLNFSSPGTYLIQVTLVDSSGFKVTRQISVTVNPDPTVNLSASSPVLDANQVLDLLVHAEGGTTPYNLTFYINGVQYPANQGVNAFNVTQPGTYDIYVNLTDSSGYTVSSNVIQVQVNPDPTLTLRYNGTVTDVGVPIVISAVSNYGTPPYHLLWDVNGETLQGQGVTLGSSPGTYDLTVFLTDSRNYTVSATLKVQVNPDPSLHLGLNQSSNNLLYTGNVLDVNASVQGGTPPYTYTWILDDREMGTTSNPQYQLTLTPGNHNLTVVVTDHLGLRAEYSTQVSASYNYLVVLSPVVVIVGAVLVVLLRRRT